MGHVHCGKGSQNYEKRKGWGVLPKRAPKLREKFVCRVLREVRKQTSIDSREENINGWVHNIESLVPRG